MPGETKDVDVTYPESYPNEALAGKQAVYKVTVKAILEEGQAELTDEYVKELSGGACENVGESYHLFQIGISDMKIFISLIPDRNK